MREVVGYYRDYLKLLGYSEGCIVQHPRNLREFLIYTEKRAERIKREDVEEYYAYLQIRPNQRRAGGLSEHFIYSQMGSLKLFFNWWQEIGRMKVKPMSALRFPVPEKKQREVLTIDEIKEL
ncbi:MAG: hypothetical protein GY810_05940, partial [Aureispira sp.]|nr:hypothetical protein [Aureispira sp.]